MQNDNKGDKCYQFLKFYTLSILPIKLHSKSMEKKQSLHSNSKKTKVFHCNFCLQDDSICSTKQT